MIYYTLIYEKQWLVTEKARLQWQKYKKMVDEATIETEDGTNKYVLAEAPTVIGLWIYEYNV